MHSKLICDLEDHIINPRYVGIISKEKEENFVFEDFIDIPEVVQNVNYAFKNNTELQYQLVDCKTSHEYNRIDYEKFDFISEGMVYAFWGVYADEDSDIAISVESPAIQKLWINDKMTTVLCLKKKVVHTIHLNKGLNVMCIEQHDSLSFFKTTIRISKIDYNQKYNSLVKNNLNFLDGEINHCSSYRSEYCFDDPNFGFVLIPIDSISLNEDTIFYAEVVDSLNKNVYERFTCRLYEKCIVDTSKYTYEQTDHFQYLTINFTYKTVNQKDCVYKINLYMTEFGDYPGYVKDKAYQLINSDNISQDAFYLIKQRLAFFNEYPPDLQNCEYFHMCERFNKQLTLIETGKYDESLFLPGEVTIYYKSDIDEDIILYNLYLPKNYDKTKEYPLIVYNSVLYGGCQSSLFSRVKKLEDVIVADAHGRDVTMGSYVGDASCREILEDICSRYKIDKTRIYAMGQSNGGYATWAQAQKTPDIFAGIYPCVSDFNEREIKNLSNLKVFYLTSEADFLHNEVCAKLTKSNLPNLEILHVEKHTHNLFEEVILSEPVIADLMKERLNLYPQRISFYTHMNRYLKAYWLEAHSIEAGKIYGGFDVHIDGNTIKIETVNITGITIHIPPYLLKDKIEILINNQVVNYSGEDKLFVGIQNDTTPNVNNDISVDTFYPKGSGIVDVYMNPLRIINYAQDKKISEVLSKPETNGFLNTIHVCYPISDTDAVYYDVMDKYNFIIIDDHKNNSSSFLKDIREQAPILTNSCGYEYHGKQYNEEYCIMQILSNPFNNKKSVLYISYNSITMANRNFFLRQMILPAYANGFHKCLNSCALIYNGVHKRVLDYLSDIEDI